MDPSEERADETPGPQPAAPPRRRRRHWHFHPVRFLVLLALTVAVLQGLLVLFARSERAREAVRRQLETELTLALERSVRIQDLTLTALPPTARISGIEIANATGGGRAPFFEADSILIRTGWLPWDHHGLRLQTIVVSGATARFEQLADGRWNIPTPTPGEDRGGRLRLERIQVLGSRLVLAGRELPVEGETRDLVGEIVSPDPDSDLILTLQARRVELVGEGPPVEAGVTFVARLGQDRLDIERLSIESGLGSLATRGRIDRSGRTTRGRLLVDGTLEVAPLTEFFDLPVRIDSSGEIDGEVSIGSDGVGFSGTFVTPRVAYRGRELRDVTARITVDREGLTTTLDDVKVADGTASARLHLTHDGDLEARLEGRGIPADLADPWLPPGSPRPSASGDLQLRFRAPVERLAEGTGSATLRLTPMNTPGREPVALDLDATLTSESVVFDLFRLRAIGCEFNATGSVALATAPASLEWSAEIDNLDPVQKVLWPLLPLTDSFEETFPLIAGRASLSGRLETTGNLADFQLEADATVSDAFSEGESFGQVTGQISVSRTSLELRDAVAQRPDGARARVDGRIYDWSADEGPYLDLDIEVEEFPARPALRTVGLDDVDIDGFATGHLVLRGAVEHLDGGGPIAGHGARFWDQAADTISGRMIFDRGDLELEEVRAELSGGSFFGRARFDLVGGRYEYSLDAVDLPLDDILIVGPSLPDGMAAVVSGHSKGAGSWDQPEISVWASARDTHLFDRRVSSEPLPFRVDFRRDRLSISVLGPGALAATLETAVSAGPRGSIEGSWEIAIDDLTSYRNFLAVERRGEFTSGALTARGTFDLRLDGGWAANGTLQRLELGTASTTVTLRGPAEIDFGADAISTELATFVSQGREFSIDGTLFLAEEDPGVDARISGELDLTALSPWLPRGLEIAGRSRVDVELTNRLQSPDLSGRVTLLDAIVRSPSLRGAGLADAIDKINGRVLLYGQRGTIEELRGHLGRRGTLDLSGTFSLDGLVPSGYRLLLEAHAIDWAGLEGFDVVAGGETILSGDLDHMSVRGEVDLEKLLYRDDMKFQLGELLAPEAPSIRASPAPWTDRVDLELHLVARDTLAVRNNLADLSGGAELLLRGTLGHPSLLGQAVLDEGGEIEFQDITYRLTSGRVFFSDPLKIDPFYELRAEADVADYLIQMSLEGRFPKLTPTFTSEPPLSREEIVYLMLTGQTQPSDNTFAGGTGSLEENITAATEATITELMFQAINRRGRELFRLDRFTIDPVLDGESQFGAGVTVGKKISKNLTVTYIYRPESTGSRQAREQLLVEYRLGRDAFIYAARDADGNASIDLKIRKKY